MNITVKLYADFAALLPTGAVHNAAVLDVADGATVKGLLKQLGVPLARAHLVLVDGVFVPPEQRAERCLRTGETLAVWPQVAGGLQISKV